MELGNNIYRYRTEKNMSQGDLANALDVSRQSVSKWETGSAVPELDKLMKMSKLFGITLDELVGNSETPPKVSPEPTIIQQIIPEKQSAISTKKIIGVILIFIGLLIIPLALSATRASAAYTCLTITAAFVVCGFFIIVQSYPYISCGWTLWAALTVYTFALTPQWEEAYFLLTLVGLFLAAMLCWTVFAHKSKTIRVPAWLWWFGGLVLAGLLILFCMNFVPPFWITNTSHTVSCD